MSKVRKWDWLDVPGLVFIGLFFFANGLWAQDTGSIFCPKNQSKVEVEKYRSQLIDKVLNGNFGSATDSLDKCYGASLPSCLSEVKEYATLKSVDRSIPGNEVAPGYGTSTPVEGVTVSSPAQLPPEFQVKNSDGTPNSSAVQMPPNILDLGKKKGWKVLPYRTRSQGGFDNGGDLLLVVIPGKDKDIYIQTSPLSGHNNSEFDDPKPKPLNGNLSEGQGTMTVITMDKTQKPPVGQLHILLQGNGTVYPWSNNLQVEKCISCHSTPLRPISPLGYEATNLGEGHMSDADQKLVDEINKMMTPSHLSWGHKLVQGKVVPVGPVHSSPPLGWAPVGDTSTLSEDFIKSCATAQSFYYHQARGGFLYKTTLSQNPTFDYKKIAKAMNCVRCHDGSRQGYLGTYYANDNVGFKIIVDRSMPPEDGLEDGLSNDERLALYSCLNRQRNQWIQTGAWVKSGEWMKREGCANPESPAVKKKTGPHHKGDGRGSSQEGAQ